MILNRYCVLVVLCAEHYYCVGTREKVLNLYTEAKREQRRFLLGNQLCLGGFLGKV